MFAYPTSLPVDEISVLAGIFRGGIKTADDAHALWTVLGFGLGQALPPAAPAISREAAAAYCETLGKNGGSAGAHAPAGVIPWTSILALAVQLLQDWLRNQG
jgi:hypothetical protein